MQRYIFYFFLFQSQEITYSIYGSTPPASGFFPKEDHLVHTDRVCVLRVLTETLAAPTDMLFPAQSVPVGAHAARARTLAELSQVGPIMLLVTILLSGVPGSKRDMDFSRRGSAITKARRDMDATQGGDRSAAWSSPFVGLIRPQLCRSGNAPARLTFAALRRHRGASGIGTN